jgi:hypothetical protein
MNSPNLQSTRLGAHDALFDDIEQALLDLTTASLDEEGVSARTVDEFALEFLIEWWRPPCAGGPQA